MKNNDDKDIEKLVDKMMSESVIESPSFDFTSKVMSQVLSFEKKKSLVYKPVISKKAWFVILAGVIALFAFLFLNIQTTNSSVNFDLSIFSFDKWFNSFADLRISSMTGNVLLLATLMLFVQIFLLKNHFNKRFEK